LARKFQQQVSPGVTQCHYFVGSEQPGDSLIDPDVCPGYYVNWEVLGQHGLIQG
jgi:hypothetical protein